MAYAAVNGADIYYEVMGEGPPLILIMGLGGNVDWWGTGFRKQLARTRQVIAFDNRGVGRSKAPDGSLTIDQMADDVAGLLDALTIERTDLFGISMGGMISQEFALRHGDRLNRLILGCTCCGGSKQIPPTPRAQQLLTTVARPISSDEAMRCQAELLFPLDFIEKHHELLQAAHKMMVQVPTSPTNFLRQLEAIQTWRGTYDRLSTLEHETLLLHGAEDILLPVQNSEIMHEVLQKSRLIQYEGCGHGFAVQVASRVVTDIQQFLST
ncbi:alpha/beta hydrolase [Alicyclobacillus fastidiosus]|uniref:Alpha/beta hydrolase n=1 Tax=Alicyclobacillus fastidiosus TaxID=392011 RepID=A0ABY6ZJ35_9BACL|nr:alpha/beta hydrolase [Alicyclobacillus fastidiosus]WAH42867.1 alpha/beta hydrolase [Alicyclobacillus fastidiosus]GMA64802.1 alpha/beta hydrolase [Alicyclobacillus fastidiosus]